MCERVVIKEVRVNAPPYGRTSGLGHRIKDDSARICAPLDLDLLSKQVHRLARKEGHVVGFGYGTGPINSALSLWRHVGFAISIPEEHLVVIRHGWFVGDRQHDVKQAAVLLYTQSWANPIRDLWDARVTRAGRLSAARAALLRAWETDASVIDRLAAKAEGSNPPTGEEWFDTLIEVEYGEAE